MEELSKGRTADSEAYSALKMREGVRKPVLFYFIKNCLLVSFLFFFFAAKFNYLYYVIIL